MTEQEQVVLKKSGTPSWRPATNLDVRKKEPGKRYRWTWNDQAHIERKIEERWHFVNPEIGGASAKHTSSHVSDGKPLDSTKTYRELVLMAIDESDAREREAYYQARTQKQTAGLKQELEASNRTEAGKGGAANIAPIHGRIVIE